VSMLGRKAGTREPESWETGPKKMWTNCCAVFLSSRNQFDGVSEAFCSDATANGRGVAKEVSIGIPQGRIPKKYSDVVRMPGAHSSWIRTL
jgi:hypothetical protein